MHVAGAWEKRAIHGVIKGGGDGMPDRLPGRREEAWY